MTRPISRERPRNLLGNENGRLQLGPRVVALVRTREAEERRLVERPPEQLEADRQPVRREPAGMLRAGRPTRFAENVWWMYEVKGASPPSIEVFRSSFGTVGSGIVGESIASRSCSRKRSLTRRWSSVRARSAVT